jgi:hypothetical protein
LPASLSLVHRSGTHSAGGSKPNDAWVSSRLSLKGSGG